MIMFVCLSIYMSDLSRNRAALSRDEMGEKLVISSCFSFILEVLLRKFSSYPLARKIWWTLNYSQCPRTVFRYSFILSINTSSEYQNYTNFTCLLDGRTVKRKCFKTKQSVYYHQASLFNMKRM